MAKLARYAHVSPDVFEEMDEDDTVGLWNAIDRLVTAERKWAESLGLELTSAVIKAIGARPAL